MELLGGVLVFAAIYVFFVKSKVDGYLERKGAGSVKREVDYFNALCTVPFSEWLVAYDKSEQPQRHGIARAFLIQAVHFAAATGAITSSVRSELDTGLKQEDPVRVVNEWIECGFPSVVDVIGKENAVKHSAREIGALMIVALSSVNPRRSLFEHLERLAS